VAAGAIAKLLLAKKGIQINAYVQEVGKIRVGKDYTELDLSKTEESIVRCPDKLVSDTMIKLIEKARREGDSLGGTIKCIAKGVPAGWGEPVFDKLHADLGKAMLSINAVKGFEYGSGFAGARMKGSEHNDVFENDGGKIITRTNFSGGIQGGISNGMDIYCNIAFKPVATISQMQETIDLKGKKTEIQGKGRHDPCVLPRAVPIVEAMAAIVLADHMLRSRLATL
jgi:chorismate synthase